jgi:DNA-binding NarL/FixJ family response regulator
MSYRHKKASDNSRPAPPAPLDHQQWADVSCRLGLSPQQTRVVELVLDDKSTCQIARNLGVRETTIKTYLERIAARTHTRGRMQLAMHVWKMSQNIAAAGAPARG